MITLGRIYMYIHVQIHVHIPGNSAAAAQRIFR